MTNSSMTHRIIAIIITLATILASAPSNGGPGIVLAFRATGDGGWSDNITVTSIGGGVYSPSVTNSNGTLHVAFTQNGVLYSFSQDGGGTWSDPITLGPDGKDTPWTPTVAAEDDLVVVFWSALKSANTRAIFWARSTDGGKTFNDSELFSGAEGNEAFEVRAIVRDGEIYVIWADNRDDVIGDHEIYFRKSPDGGGTWGPERRLTNAQRDSFHPNFEVIGNMVHIVWEDERAGPHWVYYKRSVDAGSTFGADIQICENQMAYEPDLAVVGSTVHVVWWRPSFELHYRRSLNAGTSWGSSKTILSTNDENRHEPMIDAAGTYLELVYNQNGNIEYMNSTDGGDTWGMNTTLGTGLGLIEFKGFWNPVVTTDLGSYLVYGHNDTEIRFRYKGQSPDLSVSPADISLSDPYPIGNRTAVNVTVTIHNNGDVDALGSEVLFYNGTEAPENRFAETEAGPIAVGGQSDAHATYMPVSKDPVLVVRVKGLGPLEVDLSNNLAQVQESIRNFFPVPSLRASSQLALTFEDMHFDGSNSSDEDGTVDGYWFDFGDGESLGWTVDPIATHAYSDEGNYTASLKVRDDQGAQSAWSLITVSIENREPIPRIEVSHSSGVILTGQSVEFHANASMDPDGEVVSYLWDLGDGTNSTDETVLHSYSDDGTYLVELTIIDDDGAENGTGVPILVRNRSPTVNIWTNTSIINKGGYVSFDGSGSMDPDGSITSYEWSFGDGRSRYGPSVEHRYKKAGTFLTILMATDDDGDTSIANTTIRVVDRPPVAVPDVDKLSALTLDFIGFNGQGSYDPDGQLVQYLWDFDDGSLSGAMAPMHIYQKAGIYNVTLTVTDDSEQNASATLTLVVMNRAPTSQMKVDPLVVQVNETVEFSARESKDPDGSIEEFLWDLNDGTTETGMDITHMYARAGNYTVKLTVTDDDGATDMTTVVIWVQGPYMPPQPPHNGGHGGDAGIGPFLPLATTISIGAIVVIGIVVFFRSRRKRSGSGENLEILAPDGNEADDPETWKGTADE